MEFVCSRIAVILLPSLIPGRLLGRSFIQRKDNPDLRLAILLFLFRCWDCNLNRTGLKKHCTPICKWIGILNSMPQKLQAAISLCQASNSHKINMRSKSQKIEIHNQVFAARRACKGLQIESTNLKAVAGYIS